MNVENATNVSAQIAQEEVQKESILSSVGEPVAQGATLAADVSEAVISDSTGETGAAIAEHAGAVVEAVAEASAEAGASFLEIVGGILGGLSF